MCCIASRDRAAAIADRVGEAGMTAVQLVRHIEVLRQVRVADAELGASRPLDG